MTWQETWIRILGVPAGIPEWALAAVVLALVFVFGVFPISAFVALVDRKLTADLQARVGPNRAGRFGVLQFLADFMKLLQKEATDAQSWREDFWLVVLTFVLYATAAVLPLGSAVLLVNTDASALLIFWVILVLSVGLMFLGYNQDSVPGWFSGTRLAAQVLSGAFPALVSLLCVGLVAGGFEWTRITALQSESVAAWTVFRNPFLALAFLVFMASGMVLMSVRPLDAGFSVPDIRGGVAGGFYGRKTAFFELGRFYGFFLWSVLTVTAFCGGWTVPSLLRGALEAGHADEVLIKLLEPATTVVKTLSLMVFTVLFGRVIPSLRADQVTDFNWKVLSPLSLVALIGTALWAFWGVA